MASQQMSRDELLEFVRHLPEKTSIASTLTLGYSGKQSWINWLSDYAKISDHPLRAQKQFLAYHRRNVFSI
jgi:hypothetical protein